MTIKRPKPKKPSKKRLRILTLMWMIRNRIQVEQATRVLASMGLTSRGIPLRPALAVS